MTTVRTARLQPFLDRLSADCACERRDAILIALLVDGSSPLIEGWLLPGLGGLERFPTQGTHTCAPGFYTDNEVQTALAQSPFWGFREDPYRLGDDAEGSTWWRQDFGYRRALSELLGSRVEPDRDLLLLCPLRWLPRWEQLYIDRERVVLLDLRRVVSAKGIENPARLLEELDVARADSLELADCLPQWALDARVQFPLDPSPPRLFVASSGAALRREAFKIAVDEALDDAPPRSAFWDEDSEDGRTVTVDGEQILVNDVGLWLYYALGHRFVNGKLGKRHREMATPYLSALRGPRYAEVLARFAERQLATGDAE